MFPRANLLSIMGCCNGGKGLKDCPHAEDSHHHSHSHSQSHSSKHQEGGSRKYLPECQSSSVDGGSTSSATSQILRGLPEERPAFSARQKTVVLESWQVIQRDIARVGVVLFMKLFETHPDVQDVFLPFRSRSLEDLQQSGRLRSHAMKVMGTVEKCLARIHEPDKLEALLHDLGAKHLLFNARIDYIDLIGPQFIGAVQPTMGDLWTPEIESAWADLFRLISHIMKEAMVF